MRPLLFGEFCPKDCDRMQVEAAGASSVTRVDMPYPGMGGRYRLIALPQGGTPPDGWEYAGWMRDSGGQNVTGDSNWLSRDHVVSMSMTVPGGAKSQLLTGERGGGFSGVNGGPWHPAYLVPRDDV